MNPPIHALVSRSAISNTWTTCRATVSKNWAPSVLRPLQVEEPRELVGVAVVGRAQPGEGRARLLDAPAVEGRLLRERLHQLLVAALEGGELLYLLVGEVDAALDEGARLAEHA